MISAVAKERKSLKIPCNQSSKIVVFQNQTKFNKERELHTIGMKANHAIVPWQASAIDEQ